MSLIFMSKQPRLFTRQTQKLISPYSQLNTNKLFPLKHLETQTRTLAHKASSSYQTSSSPRVVILGGGFGGINTAICIRKLLWRKQVSPKITLIDQNEDSLFKPLVFDYINGVATRQEISPKIKDVLQPYDVEFLQSRMSSISIKEATRDWSDNVFESVFAKDGESGTVFLNNGSKIPFDFLVIALGSSPNTESVMGVEKWATPLGSLEDVVKVKESLKKLRAQGGSSIVVVGGGYAGVELAATVATQVRHTLSSCEVHLFTPSDTVLPGAPHGVQQAAARGLSRLGVTVNTGARVVALKPFFPEKMKEKGNSRSTTTTSFKPCTVEYLQGKDEAQNPSPASRVADMVFWTAGSRPASFDLNLHRNEPSWPKDESSIIKETSSNVASSALPSILSPKGSIQIETTLQVRSLPMIYALGDVATMANAVHLPLTAQVAMQQAECVAWNIWSAVHRRTQVPFQYNHLGNMLSLGAVDAVVALNFAPPPPLAATAAPFAAVLGVGFEGQMQQRPGSRAQSTKPAVEPKPSKGDSVNLELGRIEKDNEGGKKQGFLTIGTTRDRRTIQEEKNTQQEMTTIVKGPIAAAMRRAVYLLRQPTPQQRCSVIRSWIGMDEKL